MKNSKESIRVWLITGNPGVGKTTVLMKAVYIIRTHGYAIGGMLSREVRIKGERTGFELVDVASGRKGVLASIKLKTGPKLGRYRVNLIDLAEIGVKGLLNAIDFCDVIVCDEIGPMELFSPDFRRAVKVVVESGKPILGIVHKRLNDPLIQELKSRSFVEVIEVTEDNRVKLPKILAERILSKVEDESHASKRL
ncbi:MAG: NTPase [Candidatus Methylarchaceae archaeon HK02M1]|nr:NTPase [Candidatus Methylarchaceae archaeon HK01M]MCP8311405.1 NTPase [Candidatus Methylarchaceae archaeon HK02M1]